MVGTGNDVDESRDNTGEDCEQASAPVRFSDGMRISVWGGASDREMHDQLAKDLGTALVRKERLGVIVRFCDCVVIVTVIVSAESLIADVAENEEGGSGHRYAALTHLGEVSVTRESRGENERQADQAVDDDPDVLVCAAAKRQGNETRWEDEPQQYRVEAAVSKKSRRENREGDDGDRDQETVHRARCRDQDGCFVAE